MSPRTPYDTIKDTVKTAFLNLGPSGEWTEVCSAIHAQSSADGVEGHGLDRIPRFTEYAQKGWINLEGKPELMDVEDTVENYDGHLGVGITSVLYRADRTMELARARGIGCVPLKNATHWIRGGTYAWRIVEVRFMGINWINTESYMLLRGSDEPGVGNNPFCIAIPRENGPIVLDMTINQYVYDELGIYRLAGEELPSPGGSDKNGNLTNDLGAIEESKRILPIGYWEGNGMAIASDMVATLMVNGNCGTDMDETNNGSRIGCCQTFIAFDSYLFGDKEDIQAVLNKRVAMADASHLEREDGRATCPGEHTITTRAKNMADGVCIDEAIWAQVQLLTVGNMETKDTASG